MKIAAAAILLCIAVRPGLGRSRESKKAPEVRLAPPLLAPVAAAEPAPPSAGSIYAMSSRLADPGRDVRAGQVGDIVTILVSDRASAIAKGATNTSRKSSVKASIPSLLGKTRAAGPLTQLASATGDQQLQGQGQTSRETTLTTTLSARVIDVRPNGTLLIEGMKDISVNSERQWILVRGLIRTGFGISYIPFPDNTYAYNFPVKQNNAYDQVSGFTPAVDSSGRAVNLTSGLPAPFTISIPSNGIITNAPLSQSYDVINLKFREGYVESWNFAIQRQLPFKFALDAAYVANHSVNVSTVYNLNAGFIAGAGAAGRPLFPLFGKSADVNMRFAGTDAHYQSLQVKLERRFSEGLLVVGSYTFGKALGYQTDNGGLPYYINQRRGFARLDFDRTNTWNHAVVYQLPFGKGKKFVQQGMMAQIAGGWTLNGGVTFMTGLPLNFSYNASGLNAPGNSQSPNVNGPVRVLGGVDNALWFDTSVFSAPANGTFGNVGRFIMAGPNLFDLSGSVARTFAITERFKLEFRSEWFSLTNTPQYDRPNTTLGDGNFGKVKGAGGNRSGQFGLRLQF